VRFERAHGELADTIALATPGQVWVELDTATAIYEALPTFFRGSCGKSPERKCIPPLVHKSLRPAKREVLVWQKRYIQ
jgi:hypothetical protein